MKKFVLILLAALTLSPASLYAQTPASLVGTYQGTLVLGEGKGLRTVVKITKDDHEKLKAVFYSIDQSPQPFPVDTISLSGHTLKFAIVPFDLTYEGTVSADSVTITGTSTQGGTPHPLNLVRPSADTAFTIPEPAAKIPNMPIDAKPGFEVATIKLADPAAHGKGFSVNGRNVKTYNTSVSDLISFAYGIHAKQIVGAPDWVDTAKFDISGQPDIEGAPSSKQLRVMLEKLLTERFNLTFHRDKKDLSVFALELGKTGSKLTVSATQEGLPSLFFRGSKGGGVLLPAKNTTMQAFCEVMQSAILDRPVVDQTGLRGNFDFNLNFSPDDTMMVGIGGAPQRAAGDTADAPPSLFDAAQQQLGLKFEATKAPVGVLVIDHIDKPSEN